MINKYGNDYEDNSTILPPMIVTLVFSFISFISTLVVIIVYLKKKEKPIAFKLIINMAISDLIFSLTIIPSLSYYLIFD